MAIYINYPTQEEKDASLSEQRQQIATLQDQLSTADAERSSTWADRKVARQELISAKAGLVTAKQSEIASSIAAAEAAVAAAQVNLDRAVGLYENARDKSDTLLDKVTRAENNLSENSKAPIFEQKSPEAQAQAAQTAESATENAKGEDLDNNEKTNLENKEEQGDSPSEQQSSQSNEDADAIARENQRLLSRFPPTTKAIDHTPGATDTQEKAAATNKTGSVPTYIPRSNPLHEYASYTYSIALYILTKDDINLLTTNPEEWSPGTGKIKTCLIASGGKNTGPYVRNENFTDDFYFDNLKMTTVIGLNNRSKSSNAIEISFGILEPYGMSLLDRIIAVASDIEAPNFKSMPYLLEIDFYGYDDTGKAVKIEKQRKRIPIKLLELKIKVGTKGAEYAVKAVPWNHQALSQSAGTTPVNLEVKASTVAEFFRNNKDDQVAITSTNNAKQSANSAIQRKESDLKAKDAEDVAARQKAAEEAAIAEGVTPTDAAGYRVSAAARTLEDQADINKYKGIVNHAFAVASYCGGVNAWFTDLILRKQRGTVDEIRVELAPSPPDCPYNIASSKITVPNNKDLTRSATKDDKPVAAAEAAAKDANRVFTDASAFAVSAGTSITQVIDMVMRNSTYVTDQVKDPQNATPQSLAEKEGKPLWWYKVIPSIKLGQYDYALNKFSTITTYHVVPYRVYDSKHPNGPSVAPQGSIKEYNYSYTGKNVDILDFQIDFDTLFYTAVTAGSAKWESTQISRVETQKDSAAKVAAESQPAAAELVNRQIQMVSTQPQAAGAGGTQNGVKPVLAADIQKSQYSNSRGDMLNLKLKIVGDPELIKQDDIYTNPSQGGYADQSRTTGVMNNGSIVMDTGEVLSQVSFRTIVDMDDKTGLPRQDAYAKNSVFTGLYRILTVENVFHNGKFEQTVDMVRVPDAINSGSKDDKKGQQTSNNKALGGTVTPDTAPGTRAITSQDGAPADNTGEFQGIEMSSPPAATADPTTTEGYGVDEVGATPAEVALTEPPPLSDDDLTLASINESAPAVNIDDYYAEQSVNREAPMVNADTTVLTDNNFA
jgi:hypothetical protein